MTPPTDPGFDDDELAADGDDIIGPLDPNPQPPPVIPEGAEVAG